MEKVGLIPCAGEGKRLGLSFSKEMFPDIYQKNYTPIIFYTIENMKNAGIDHIVFTINPSKTDLLNYLGNGKQFGLKFSYCIHPKPQSLPHSINEAYHIIKNKTVVFAMPDTIITPNNYLDALLCSHINNTNSKITLGCYITNNPQKFGMVKLNNNLVDEIIDKPDSTTLKWMWGSIVWEPECTEKINNFVESSHEIDKKELVLTDAFYDFINMKKVYSCLFPNHKYRDLGTYGEIINWINTYQND